MGYSIGSSRGGSSRRRQMPYFDRLSGTEREHEFTLHGTDGNGAPRVAGIVRVYDDRGEPYEDERGRFVDVRGTGMHVQVLQPGKHPQGSGIAVIHSGEVNVVEDLAEIMTATAAALREIEDRVTGTPVRVQHATPANRLRHRAVA